MKNSSLAFAALVVLTFVLANCQHQEKKAAVAASSWAAGMQKMSGQIQKIAVLIFSESGFENPLNKKLIQSTLSELIQTSKDLSNQKDLEKVDRDPSLTAAMTELHEQFKDSAAALSEGKKSYARRNLETALNQCVHCHTRNNYGPALPQNLWSQSQIQSLKPVERASLAVALRDYDEALSVLEIYLSQTTRVDNFFQLDRALKTYLSVSVKVKQKPERALDTVRQVRNKDGLPFYLKTDLTDWEKALVAWQKETKKSGKPNLADAKALLKKGIKDDNTPVNGTAYVYLLRASTEVNNYLQTDPPKKSLAEADLILGQVYENMSDLNSNDLSEYYYESCILQEPKTELSKNCYERLEKLVFFGYSGSSGTNLPNSVKQKLDRLKAAAM